jgi:hypothetical protein
MGGKEFRKNEQADEPAPCQEMESEVMPQRYECKHKNRVENDTSCPTKWDVDIPSGRRIRTSEQMVNIQLWALPDYPEIVAAMPASPEPERGVIICHTSHHVLGWVYTVHECPQPKESPRYQEL